MVRGLVVLLALLALPGAAFAQEPGVNVDPDSPSGKEYAIPLDRARGQAAPSASAPQRSSGPSAPAASAPATSTPATSAPSSGGDDSESKSEEPESDGQDTVLFGSGVTPESVKSGASDAAALTAAKAAADSADGGVPPWLLAVAVAALGVGAGALIRWLKRRASAG